MTAPLAREARRLLRDIVGHDPLTPTAAMLEIVDRCNESCAHCYQVQGLKGELSTEELKSIMDELAKMGVLMLTLSGGEPLLREDFLDLVAHARAHNFAVQVFTNGLLIDDAMADSLAELGIFSVELSLYASDASRHDAITAVPGSFERTLAAGRRLRARDVTVVFKTTLMRTNVGDVDAIRVIARDMGAIVTFADQVDPREDGNRDPELLRMTDDELRAARSAVGIERGGSVPAADPASTPCLACQGTIQVEPNGEMRPCTALTVPVGHAVRDGVRSALHENPVAQQIRSVTWGDLVGCRECDLSGICNRCYQVARVESGDALGPYASACHRARVRASEIEGAHVRFSDPEGRGVGPYRRGEAGEYTAVSPTRTAADDERGQWSWTRMNPGANARPHPEGLVPLRRPGGRGRDGAMDVAAAGCSPPGNHATMPSESGADS